MTQYFFLPQYFESNKQILNRYIKRSLKNHVYKNPAPGVRGWGGFSYGVLLSVIYLIGNNMLNLKN